VSKQSAGWRVWLDGKAGSPVYHLKASHRRYLPQGIGENWSPSSTCNTFDWPFDNVRVLRAGRHWITRGKPGYRWQDAGYEVRLIPPSSFETMSR
jgi:hypothetical protein